MILNKRPPKNFIMHKFSIRQQAKRFWLVISILIVGIIGMFSSSALATFQQAQDSPNSFFGKDIVGVGLPFAVTNTATASENTWGRVIRITGNNAARVQPTNRTSFFDIGVDNQGNFFINSHVDTKTSHSLMISPEGVVTIPRKG